MHRQPLLALLDRYCPVEPAEMEARRRIESFIRAQPLCFSRSLTVGHITGSAWLLNTTWSHVLLTHHRKLGQWLQLGGHADGCGDVLAVALREAREESGIEKIAPVSTEIFDLDVHAIPARGDEPGHFHYDVRFLMQTVGDSAFRVSDESHELAWVSKEELPIMNVDESVLRMHRKWVARALGSSNRTD